MNYIIFIDVEGTLTPGKFKLLDLKYLPKIQDLSPARNPIRVRHARGYAKSRGFLPQWSQQAIMEQEVKCCNADTSN